MGTIQTQLAYCSKQICKSIKKKTKILTTSLLVGVAAPFDGELILSEARCHERVFDAWVPSGHTSNNLKIRNNSHTINYEK